MQLDQTDHAVLENCISQAIQNADAFYPLSVRHKASAAAIKVLEDYDGGVGHD